MSTPQRRFGGSLTLPWGAGVEGSRHESAGRAACHRQNLRLGVVVAALRGDGAARGERRPEL